VHGHFSHVIRKIAGKTPILAVPSPTATHVVPVHHSDLLEDALVLSQRAIQTLPQQVVFARVDAVKHREKGIYCVNEVELIEPQLFLRAAPHAAVGAAQAIEQENRTVEQPLNHSRARRNLHQHQRNSRLYDSRRTKYS
jgi:hypothetical protein